MEESGSENGRRVSRGSKKAQGNGGRGATNVLVEEKELIRFLKEQKIEHYKTDKYDIKFSPLAHLPELPKAPTSNTVDEDELLYYSAGERPTPRE